MSGSVDFFHEIHSHLCTARRGRNSPLPPPPKKHRNQHLVLCPEEGKNERKRVEKGGNS